MAAANVRSLAADIEQISRSVRQTGDNYTAEDILRTALDVYELASRLEEDTND